MNSTPSPSPAIGILGANGRMGRAIADLAREQGLTLAGGIDREGAAFGPYPDAVALAAAADVLIDFSTPAALDANLAAAEATGTPIVIGTTGLLPEHHARIDRAADRIAVLQSANTSVGVAMLRALVAQAAARLGTDWDIEIVEMHHRHKVDAPSGTALLLGAAAAEGRGGAIDALGRTGHAAGAARAEGTIGFASLRGGSVAGDHSVIFATEGERIELGHRAESRRIFAAGAIRAALWLAGRPAGRTGMTDLLGL